MELAAEGPGQVAGHGLGLGRPVDADGVRLLPPATFTVYAHRERVGDRLSESSATTTVGGDAVGSTAARCRGRQRAVSGGFRGVAVPGVLVLPQTSRRRGSRRWSVSAANASFAAGPLTAFAYCARP